MIKSLVSIPLDMRVDVIEQQDFGPGRKKEYFILWAGLPCSTAPKFQWISSLQMEALEKLFEAWPNKPCLKAASPGDGTWETCLPGGGC